MSDTKNTLSYLDIARTLGIECDEETAYYELERRYCESGVEEEQVWGCDLDSNGELEVRCYTRTVDWEFDPYSIQPEGAASVFWDCATEE